ncbi:MAG: ABC transporter substrate-binding protein [Stellaceae bacterium]
MRRHLGINGNLPLCVVAIAAALSVAAAGPSFAEIKVGISAPATGVGAAFGVPMMKAVKLLPKEIDGQHVEYITLDSNTDATRAAANARKLVSEDHVDVLIGDSTTPATLAMVTVAADSKTPLIAPAAPAILVEPMNAVHRWIFKVVPNDNIGARTIIRYMVHLKVKTLGFIGFNDAYGEGWLDLLKKMLPAHHIKIVDTEFYNRTDTSVTAQALKLTVAHPDAVFVASGGTPAIVPAHDLRARGYKGPILQTHGVSTPVFINRGGKDVDGTVFAGEPFIIAKDLPDSSPFKKPALDFIARYKAMYGKVPPIMAANMLDAVTLLAAAVPTALKDGKPGTAAFRAGLRDGMEHVKDLYLSNGLLTNTPQNHAGFDPRGSFLVEVKDGGFHLLKLK